MRSTSAHRRKGPRTDKRDRGDISTNYQLTINWETSMEGGCELHQVVHQGYTIVRDKKLMRSLVQGEINL